MIRDEDNKRLVPLTPSGLRLGLILTIVFMVVSSPIIIFNPALAVTASASSQPLPTISTIPSAPSTIGQDGREGDFTTQATISSLTARPTNNIVNTNSFYDIVFLTATSGAIKSIQVTFPAGTTIPSGAFFNEAEGIGPGTASKSGQTITYTVTNAVDVPAGTKIRLEFANINNPLNPSANFIVTVTTRNAANTPIDGPTPSSFYTMKQIGTSEVADNAVTTPKIAGGAVTENKIADGSITSTKPAESFMKRIALFDDAEGNALGWNPNGITTDFTITAPIDEDSFISIMLPRSCSVAFGLDFGFFTFECDNAPPEGSVLSYLITNLPLHINE